MDITITILLKICAGTLLGYTVSKTMTHQKGKLRKKVPTIKLKWVQVLPHLKINIKSKNIHIHHWLSLPTMYIPLIMSSDLIRAQVFLHAIVLGAVIQGLRYRDRFVFFYNEFLEKEYLHPKH
jgi:hypothetical protein